VTTSAIPLLLALAGPAGAFELHPAAVLDPAPFSYAAPVRVRPSAEGVSRIRLSPALLSLAAQDLADLRVVDAAGQQWPFVPVIDAGREPVELVVVPLAAAKGARPEPGRSRFRLVPEVAPVTLDGLVVRVDRESYRRAYRLSGELPGGQELWLGAGFLERAAGGEAQVPVPMPRARVSALVLEVDDGDEVPLPLAAAHADAKVAELRLLAPAGAYTLLAGDPQARAPRYEIGETAVGRDRVIAAPAGDADVGAPAPNGQHKLAAAAPGDWEKNALWAVLTLAVAALGALTLRLSRKEPPPGGEAPPT
jgi:hypothetical protein